MFILKQLFITILTGVIPAIILFVQSDGPADYIDTINLLTVDPLIFQYFMGLFGFYLVFNLFVYFVFLKSKTQEIKARSVLGVLRDSAGTLKGIYQSIAGIIGTTLVIWLVTEPSSFNLGFGLWNLIFCISIVGFSAGLDFMLNMNRRLIIR